MRVVTSLLLMLFSWNAISESELPALDVQKIDNGIYLHRSYKQVKGFGLVDSNGLILVKDNKALIIDTPWSGEDTQLLVTWIKEHNFTLLGSVSTHSHEDRTAGIEWLNSQDIPTFASELTNAFLKRDNKPIASETLKGDHGLLVGEFSEFFYPGKGHAADNIVIWHPESKSLFGGCLVRSLKTVGLGYTVEAYIGNWKHSVIKLTEKYPDAKRIIPGHGDIGNAQLILHTAELVEKNSVQLKP